MKRGRSSKPTRTTQDSLRSDPSALRSQCVCACAGIRREATANNEKVNSPDVNVGLHPPPTCGLGSPHDRARFLRCLSRANQNRPSRSSANYILPRKSMSSSAALPTKITLIVRKSLHPKNNHGNILRKQERNYRFVVLCK